MKFVRVLSFAAVFGALAVIAAQAADMRPVRQASVPYTTPVYNWGGWYLGGQAGGAWSKSDYTVDFAGFNVASGSMTDSGFIGGAHGGYLWQTGPLVYGVEGDFNAAASRSTTVFATTASVGGLWTSSVRGRFGYAWDRFLAYGTAGAAFMHADYTIGPESWSVTKPGWTAGLGIEYALFDHIRVGAEYRYSGFGRMSHDFGTFPGLSLSQTLDSQTLVGRLSVKF